MKKGKWKTKDEEIFIILKRLSDHAVLERKDFEKNRSVDSGDAASLDGIPHSSVIKIMKELVKEGCVYEWKTRRYTWGKRPIRRYSIRPLGHIKLFRLAPRFKYDISLCEIENFIPDLKDYVALLREVFSDDTILKTFCQMCTNIRMDETVPSWNSKPDYAIIPIPGSLLRKKYSEIKYVQIEMPVPHRYSNVSIRKKSFLVKKKKEKYFETLTEEQHPYYTAKRLIAFAFIYELLRNIDSLEYDLNTPETVGRKIVLRIIRSSAFLRSIFQEYLSTIEFDLLHDSKQVTKIKKIIKRKL